MKLEKIKLMDLVNEQLTSKELELLKGGNMNSACDKKVCSIGMNSSTQYCTSGDGICTQKQM